MARRHEVERDHRRADHQPRRAHQRRHASPWSPRCRRSGFRPPDDLAVGRLIRLYGRGLIDDNADLNEVGKLLGKIPCGHP